MSTVREETSNGRPRRNRVVRVRSEADTLLGRLQRDRLEIERRWAEAGRVDPLKLVTGATALDRAIADTEEIIRSMDRILGELMREQPAPDPPVPVPVATP